MNSGKLGWTIARKIKEAEQLISIGIDVSKGKSKVCAINHYGEVLISPHDVIHTKPSLGQAGAAITIFK